MSASLSLSAFAFFLLILCVGYVFVEALGSRYNHKIVAENAFERAIHYTIRGMVAHFIIFVLAAKAAPLMASLINMYHFFAPFANIFPGEEISIQIFIMITAYFAICIIIATIVGFAIRRITDHLWPMKK